MKFETEYQLKEFNDVKKQHFDKNNKCYEGNHPANHIFIMEQMLKLIQQMETEIKELQHHKDTVVGLWAIDVIPREVTKYWIEKNAFQIKG